MHTDNPDIGRGGMRRFVLAGLGMMAALVVLALGSSGRALAVASVAFHAPPSTTCASAQNISVSVYDTNGFPAPGNTAVTFATTLGYITTPSYTYGNTATVSLVIPPKLSGTAMVTASALGISGTKSINVTCASTTTAAPVFTSVVAPPAPAQPPVAPAYVAPAQMAVNAPAVAAPVAASPTTMGISVTEYSYTPASFNVRVGQPVTLNVTNTGRASHTFTIAGVTDSGSISGGGSKSVSFTPSQAGTLTFYCTIHGASVMSGKITVTP